MLELGGAVVGTNKLLFMEKLCTCCCKGLLDVRIKWYFLNSCKTNNDNSKLCSRIIVLGKVLMTFVL